MHTNLLSARQRVVGRGLALFSEYEPGANRGYFPVRLRCTPAAACGAALQAKPAGTDAKRHTCRCCRLFFRVQAQSESLNSARANDIKEAFNVRNTGMAWRGTPEVRAAYIDSRRSCGQSWHDC